MPPGNYVKYNTNDKYQREIDKFKGWMDANSRRPTPDSPYLSRANVDNYYVQVVEVDRIGINADSAAAIHRGLQWFSDNIENPGNAGEPLTIRDENTPNSIVNQSLWRRELSFVQWLRVNGESDPHANLPTQSLSFLEHEKTIKFVLAHTGEEPVWLQFAISWCVNYATYLRMDSLRKIWLCDLLCESRGYVQRGRNSNIIGLILQKYVCKDQTPQNPNARKRTKQKRAGRNNPAGDNNGQAGQPIATGGKRVCFMWRHRIFECCGTSMIGISLFMRFFFDTETSFLETEKPPQPPPDNNNNNPQGGGIFEQQPRRRGRRNNNNVSKKRELNANA
jgi:hypothetical protein